MSTCLKELLWDPFGNVYTNWMVILKVILNWVQHPLYFVSFLQPLKLKGFDLSNPYMSYFTVQSLYTKILNVLIINNSSIDSVEFRLKEVGINTLSLLDLKVLKSFSLRTWPTQLTAISAGLPNPPPPLPPHSMSHRTMKNLPFAVCHLFVCWHLPSYLRMWLELATSLSLPLSISIFLCLTLLGLRWGLSCHSWPVAVARIP